MTQGLVISKMCNGGPSYGVGEASRAHLKGSLASPISITRKRTSFAVVQERERLFGIDNLGGWHCHPLGKPEDHKPIDEPSIEEIVAQCSIAINDLKEEVT